MIRKRGAQKKTYVTDNKGLSTVSYQCSNAFWLRIPHNVQKIFRFTYSDGNVTRDITKKMDEY